MRSVPVTVLVNHRAGASERQRERLETAFRRARLHARVIRVRGPDVAAAAREAAGNGGILVAAGGDGTVSSVAAVALERGATLGVIPLGTLNHFARDAGIPLDLDKAVGAIAAGRTNRMDVGDVNGRPFLNNASLGLYPRLVWERQLQERRGRPKWRAFAIALLKTWVRHRTMTARMTLDDVELVRRTPFVFVGNGKYQTEGLGLGSRVAINDGRLSVYLAPESGRLDTLMLSLRALARRLTPEVKFEVFSAATVAIDVNRRHTTVALDGELVEMSPPLRCSIRRRPLRVVVPET